MAAPLIVSKGLSKSFRLGLLRKRIEAVKSVDFQVEEGEIFGFLGPNGAGKTTTIKMLTGLIRPTSGTATVFDRPVPSPRAMQDVGFLPENPYVYPYVTPREFVEMCGRLSGLRRRAVIDRTRQVLERVGVLYAADRPVRKLSKGMLQRTGLAAALVADPKLLILDEPMSGLDPVGRKEVKDLILDERRQGRTIFFSTHILSDVEALCDDVAILRQGRVVVRGKLRELLKSEVQRTDVTVIGADDAFERRCEQAGHLTRRMGEHTIVEIEGRAKVSETVAAALRAGLEVLEVVPRTETLEALFVREAIASAESDSNTSTPNC